MDQSSSRQYQRHQMINTSLLAAGFLDTDRCSFCDVDEHPPSVTMHRSHACGWIPRRNARLALLSSLPTL